MAKNAALFELMQKALTDITSKPSGARGTCSIDGCSGNKLSNGYCNAHYLRSKKGMDLTLPVKTRKRNAACSECGEPTGSKGGWGLCNKHYKKKRRVVLKQVAVDYLGGCCHACGGTFPLPVYDFHHTGDKDLSIGDSWVNASAETIAVEIEKCILLCANCHRIEHGEECNF